MQPAKVVLKLSLNSSSYIDFQLPREQVYGLLLFISYEIYLGETLVCFCQMADREIRATLRRFDDGNYLTCSASFGILVSAFLAQ